MTLSMYEASVPAFVRVLTQLDQILAKAEAYAAARKIDPAVLVNARLYPDMFTLGRQVQIVTDFAKGACARLSGQDVPNWPDTEATFGELRTRIARALALVGTFKPADIDGSEEREIKMKIAGEPVVFRGKPYLVHFVLPNLYFHAATAYGILRHNGLDVGKRDFIGGLG